MNNMRVCFILSLFLFCNGYYAQSSKSNYVREVSSARSRLDETLQSLVDKKDDSMTAYDSSQESDEGSDIVPITVEVVRSSGTQMSSPRKYHVAQPRAKKRKRKDDSHYGDEEGNYQRKSGIETTYVMKLFDRSVDLAQFTESTPLYPIARKWINGKETTYVMKLFDRSVDLAQFTESTPLYPIARKWINGKGHNYTEPTDKPEEELSVDNVYELPPPFKLKMEVGEDVKDARIPEPIPSTERPLDIHADPDQGPPPEELLLRHMDRWKRIRSSWIQAARVNEIKYRSSLTIIKDIFEKNLQDQSFES